jgi:ABC-type Fe3+/spermidine/putrescine transport system ATPase subunit
MSASYVEVRDLSVTYGRVTAVDSLTFDVGAGEHVTLLGPSGCGKTTTLRAVAGLERPSAGRIMAGGEPVFDAHQGINRPPEKRGLAMVFQSYAIWPHMSVFENVAFSFRVRRRPRDLTRAAVEKAVALVGLQGFADRPATQLSGGQQQRVALARAIAQETNLILFDEPLSNLDAQLRLAMRSELAELRRRLGFAAIYVTHDQEEACALSDRIVVMRNGRIEQEGRPFELYRKPKTRFVAGFLGMSNILKAEVTQGPGSALTARLAPEVSVGASAPWGLPAGRTLAVGFRPSDVQVFFAGSEGVGIEGEITRIVFTGDLMSFAIRSGPLEIKASDRPRPELQIGTRLRWRVPIESLIVLAD